MLKKLLMISLFTTTLQAAEIPVTPQAPDIDAESYILTDYHTGKVLAQKDPDKPLDPASITKIMAIYIIDHELKAGKISLNDEVPISENAWKTEGSRMFVQVNTKVPVKDLMSGVIIESGNDATVALAEYVAGTESAFVDLMNQYAKQLGMTNTHFANSYGLPHPDHHSTARDLSTLARAMIKHFPNTYKIYSEKSFTYNKITQPNRNRLLTIDPTVDGIKTGHSSTAGYCLAASSYKDGMRLISIVLGAETERKRTEESLQLLRYGFRFYETKRVFQANTAIQSPRVWMGSPKNVALGIKEDFYVTIPQGQYQNLVAKMQINKNITAPIKQGDVQGKIVITLQDKPFAEIPLVALGGVKEGSLWDKASDFFYQKLNKLVNE